MNTPLTATLLSCTHLVPVEADAFVAAQKVVALLVHPAWSILKAFINVYNEKRL